jgi:hypothetical protein
MKASSIPFIYLTKLYLESDFDVETGLKFVQFIASFSRGELGLPPDTLDGFINLLGNHQLFTEGDLDVFIKSQMLGLCKSPALIDQFFKSMRDLMVPAEDRAVLQSN